MSTHLIRSQSDVDYIIATALHERGAPGIINAEFRDLVSAYAEERFGASGGFSEQEIEEITQFIVRLFELAGPRS